MEVRYIPKDELFALLALPENEGYKENLYYFHDGLAQNQEHVAALDGTVVAGLRGAYFHQGRWEVTYITIHPKYRSQGLVRKITKAFLSHVQSTTPEAPVLNSRYSPEGMVLVPMWTELAQEYSNLKIFHKVRGMGDQDAKFPLLEYDDKVIATIEGVDYETTVNDCGLNPNMEAYVSVKIPGENYVRVPRSQIKKI